MLFELIMLSGMLCSFLGCYLLTSQVLRPVAPARLSAILVAVSFFGTVALAIFCYLQICTLDNSKQPPSWLLTAPAFLVSISGTLGLGFGFLQQRFCLKHAATEIATQPITER